MFGSIGYHDHGNARTDAIQTLQLKYVEDVLTIEEHNEKLYKEWMADADGHEAHGWHELAAECREIAKKYAA